MEQEEDSEEEEIEGVYGTSSTGKSSWDELKRNIINGKVKIDSFTEYDVPDEAIPDPVLRELNSQSRGRITMRDVRRDLENKKRDFKESFELREEKLRNNPSPDTEKRYYKKFEKNWSYVFPEWPEELRRKFFKVSISGILLEMSPEETEEFMFKNFSPYYTSPDYLDGSQSFVNRCGYSNSKMGLMNIQLHSPDSQAAASWNIRRDFREEIETQVDAINHRMESFRKLVQMPDIIEDAHDQIRAELTYRRVALQDLKNRIDFYNIHLSMWGIRVVNQIEYLIEKNENQITVFNELYKDKSIEKEFEYIVDDCKDDLKFIKDAERDFGEQWDRFNLKWLYDISLYDLYDETADPKELLECWNKYTPRKGTDSYKEAQELNHAIWLDGQN